MFWTTSRVISIPFCQPAQGAAKLFPSPFLLFSAMLFLVNWSASLLSALMMQEDLNKGKKRYFKKSDFCDYGKRHRLRSFPKLEN